MLRSKKYLFSISLAFALPLWAHSYQPYMSVGLGVVVPSHDITIEGDSTYDLYNPTSLGSSIFQLPDMRWKNDFKTGADVSLSIGHQLPHHFRMEGEFIYQYMPRETSGTYGWQERYSSSGALYASQPGNPLNVEETDANLYVLMANLFYDFENSTAWTPFLGAGVGVAWLDSESNTSANQLHIDLTTPPLNATANTAETTPQLYGTAFAWQVKLGLNYEWTEHMSFDAVYRLLGTTDFQQKDGKIITNPELPGDAAYFSLPQGDVDGLLNNSFYLGFRYAF